MGKLTNLNPSAPITDAESVDGIDSSRIVYGDDWSKTIGQGVGLETVFTTSAFLDCASAGGTFPTGITRINGFQSRHRNNSSFWGMQAGCQHNINNEFYFRTVTAGSWQPWRRIWNDGNFTPSSHTQTFSSTIKGIGTSTGGIATTDNTQANRCGWEVQSADANSAAYMSFHRPGIYGLHFGLNTNNQLCIGGWSLGNVSYRLLHEGMPVSAKGNFETANIAGNSVVWAWNSVEIGQGVAEVCNYAGLGGVNTAYSFYLLQGNANVKPTLSNRIARIEATGNYISTSDERIKSHFSEAPGLDVIMALKPLKYRHLYCTGFDKKNHVVTTNNQQYIEKLGFSAQEVQKVLPEVVSVPQSEEELYGIDYNGLITVTVRALQEQQRQIDELKQQVQDLSKV